jgi:hypothetical protein
LWSGRILRDDMALLGPPYWRVVGIGLVFALARFSEAFLVLKGQAAGLPVALVPLVMVWMNVVYAAVSTGAVANCVEIRFGGVSDGVRLSGQAARSRH